MLLPDVCRPQQVHRQVHVYTVHLHMSQAKFLGAVLFICGKTIEALPIELASQQC